MGAIGRILGGRVGPQGAPPLFDVDRAEHRPFSHRPGRLVAPVGSSVFGHDLVVFDKDQNGRIRSQSVGAVRFVPLTSRESQLRSPLGG